MPNLYRRRPAEIEAVQWTDTNATELTTFAGQRFMTIDPEDRVEDPEATASLLESAHESWALLCPGDWVVKRGDAFEVLTAEEFADLYEPVEPRCPRCGCSLADYTEDEVVFRADDLRAYCSGECVIAAQTADPDEEREDLLTTYRDMIVGQEFAPRGSVFDGTLRFLLGEIDRLRSVPEPKAVLLQAAEAAMADHQYFEVYGPRVASWLRGKAVEASSPQSGMSPAYARLQAAAGKASAEAAAHALRGMRRVFQLARRYGTAPIPAAEVLQALRLDENANTIEAPQPETATYEQVADRLDAEHARRVKAAWSPTEHNAAEEWSSVAAFVRGLAREQQAAEEAHRG